MPWSALASAALPAPTPVTAWTARAVSPLRQLNSVRSTQVPATPDAEQARQAAAHELAKEVYQDRPSIWDLAWQWLLTHMDPRTVVPGVPAWVSTAIVVLTGLLLLAGLIVVLRRATPLRKTPESSPPLFEDRRDSQALAAAADAAAQAGHWEAAVLERFRSIIRTLDEYGLLEDYPGLTAHSAGQDAGAALPALARDLAESAQVFDSVRYGPLTPTASQDQAMRHLAQRVSQTVSDASAAAAGPAGVQAPGGPTSTTAGRVPAEATETQV